MADEQEWVVCSDDCEQTALGFTGERAWKTGVPKLLSKTVADSLTAGEGSPFSLTTDPNAPAPPDHVPDPVPAAPLSDEALTPPDAPVTPPAQSDAQETAAAPAAEGSAQ